VYKRQVVGGAANVLLGGPAPDPEDLRVWSQRNVEGDQVRELSGVTGRLDGNDAVGFRVELPKQFGGDVVVVLESSGSDAVKNSELAKSLLENGFAVLHASLLEADESSFAVDEGFYGYTYGYNRPLLSERVRDVLNLVTLARQNPSVQRVHLAGRGRAGVWAVAGAAIAGSNIDSISASVDGFRFGNITSVADPDFLPGAAKYGGLIGLAALAAPARTQIGGLDAEADSDSETWPLKLMHSRTDSPIVVKQAQLTNEAIVAWLQKAD